MAHLNVKPLDRNQIHVTGDQAIQHIFSHGVWSKNWDFGGASFGRSIDDRRKIDTAIKARDFSAFNASKRRGYWRIDLV
jgi:hypothetical protein